MELFSGFEHIVRDNEPLSPYNWFRLGGVAEYFAEPTTPDEVAGLVQRCREENLPFKILGGGSNLLIKDEGTPGLVIHLAAPAFSDITVQGETITAGAGAKLGHVISTAVREGLAGMEELVGIPGTVGGALRGNAGAQTSDIGQWTRSVTVMSSDGEVTVREANDLRFSYRQSNLGGLVILQAQFALEPGDSQTLTKRMQTLWIIRKSQQPTGDQNAGHIFKDPGGVSAASLIDQAGLKGAMVGKAAVCDQYANFITAHPGASSQDVLRLIDLIQGRVSEHLGVELETEIEIW